VGKVIEKNSCRKLHFCHLITLAFVVEAHCVCFNECRIEDKGNYRLTSRKDFLWVKKPKFMHEIQLFVLKLL